MNWLARLKKLENTPASTLQKLQKEEKGVSVVFVGASLEPFQNSASENGMLAARLALFTGRGMSMEDAEARAVRMESRDRERDDRRLCLECLHLSGGAGGWRCSQWRKRQCNGPDIPGDLVTVVLHRCAGFKDRLEGTA